MPFNSPGQSQRCKSLFWGPRAFSLVLLSLTFHSHGDSPGLGAVHVGGQAAVGACILSRHAQPLRLGYALSGAAHLREGATTGGASQGGSLGPF